MVRLRETGRAGLLGHSDKQTAKRLLPLLKRRQPYGGPAEKKGAPRKAPRVLPYCLHPGLHAKAGDSGFVAETEARG